MGFSQWIADTWQGWRRGSAVPAQLQVEEIADDLYYHRDSDTYLDGQGRELDVTIDQDGTIHVHGLAQPAPQPSVPQRAAQPAQIIVPQYAPHDDEEESESYSAGRGHDFVKGAIRNFVGVAGPLIILYALGEGNAEVYSGFQPFQLAANISVPYLFGYFIEALGLASLFAFAHYIRERKSVGMMVGSGLAFLGIAINSTYTQYVLLIVQRSQGHLNIPSAAFQGQLIGSPEAFLLFRAVMFNLSEVVLLFVVLRLRIDPIKAMQHKMKKNAETFVESILRTQSDTVLEHARAYKHGGAFTTPPPVVVMRDHHITVDTTPARTALPARSTTLTPPRTGPQPTTPQPPVHRPEDIPAPAPASLPAPVTVPDQHDTGLLDKLNVAIDAVRDNSGVTDEDLADIMGLSRPASARFWKLKAIDVLTDHGRTQLPPPVTFSDKIPARHEPEVLPLHGVGNAAATLKPPVVPKDAPVFPLNGTAPGNFHTVTAAPVSAPVPQTDVVVPQRATELDDDDKEGAVTPLPFVKPLLQ